MSGYLQGLGSYSPHAHYHPPLSAGPLTAYDSDDDLSSDFDVFERDIDAEMEARERERRQRCRATPQPEPEPAFQPTLSQRMLHSLKQSRVATHSVSRRANTTEDSMYDLRSVMDESVASTDRLTVVDAPLSSRSGSSCTDRLEARISKSFLSNKADNGGLEAVDETHNASIMYSGRRTYPAESLRTTEHSRLSDNPPAATPQETKMMGILEKERATRVFSSQRSTPEVQRMKDSGVRFHFRRGSSVDVEAASRGMSRMALTPSRNDALMRAQPAKRVTDPEYTTLASQLAEIESLVDGIETCMDAPAFGTLAARVVQEMELLTKTTLQIRTNGTTVILANMGQQNEFTQALRRLVARAAAVQNRIGYLKEEVKALAV